MTAATATLRPSFDWRRTWTFCALHLPHLLVAPVMLFVFGTFLHELAHVAAALLQGATITHFEFMPTAGHLGQMQYLPRFGDTSFDHDFVAVAPYLMWSAFAAFVIFIASFPNRMHWMVSSTLFTWFYALPIGDIALNLYSGSGDLYVPGIEGLVLVIFGTGLLGVAYAIGYWVQKKLYGERAVDIGGYLIATVVLGIGMAAAGLVGLTILSV